MSWVKEFTVHLPSDAKGGNNSNPSASFEVEFDKDWHLDENVDWYVGVKELYLPTHQLPKTEWSGSVTMYPTKSEAPYATTLMKVKTKEYKFKYTDVSGGKVFEADNKTYTAGASNYLKAALKAVGTAQDDWRFHDWASYLIFQCFHMQGVPNSETREDNFVEPYDWGRLEFRGSGAHCEDQ